MGQKICPLSFFNFYINKEAAQAGGCHLCVEEACALWDENYQQCSMKSGLDAVGVIADLFSNSEKEEHEPFPKSSPIDGIFNKLRKKKLEGNIPSKVVLPAPAPPPPPPPAPVSVSSAAVVVTTPVTGQTPLAVNNGEVVIVGNPSKDSPIETSDVINRPQVPISELPIITLNSSSKEDDLKL